MDAPTSGSSSAAQTGSPPSPTAANRRNSAGLFSSLMEQKRGDATSARRQSLHDQRPKAGIFGQMWNNFARGQQNEPK